MDAATNSHVATLLPVLGLAAGRTSVSSGRSRPHTVPSAVLLSSRNVVDARNQSSPQSPIVVRRADSLTPGPRSAAPLQLGRSRGSGDPLMVIPFQRSRLRNLEKVESCLW